MRRISRETKRLSRMCFPALFFAFALIFLSGCIPKDFTAKEEATFLKEAKTVVSDFLADRCSGAKVTDIEAETAVEDGYLVLTAFASGEFVWQEQIYRFVVDTQTGEVYTSVALSELAGRLRQELLESFDISATAAAVQGITVRYLKGSANVDVASAFYNVFPGNKTAEELYPKLTQNTDEYSFSIRIQYKGESLPEGIMEQASPFPAMSGLTIYHVAAEHGFYSAEFGSSVMPSLSEEILQFNFGQGTAACTKNEVLEQDGFFVVYNACERTLKDGVVTESVIAREDIALTVTEDYIALGCAKDNYVMYLSAADKKTVEKYLYTVSGRTAGGEDIIKGMWYTCGDRYVFAKSDTMEVPHEFTARHPQECTVYTKSAAKKLR